MPNLGNVLKDEIARLSRRALRGEIDGVKRASAQQRKHIAALKRQVDLLERQVTTLARSIIATRPAASAAPRQPTRFVAKGLRSLRGRLGLSAAEFGRLAGVSAQAVYNWEREVAHPAPVQLARVVALRSIGKREAAKQLAALGASGNSGRKR